MRPLRTYCYDDPTCIGQFVHSGPHRPGCRICDQPGHLTRTCPTWGTDGDPMSPTNEHDMGEIVQSALERYGYASLRAHILPPRDTEPMRILVVPEPDGFRDATPVYVLTVSEPHPVSTPGEWHALARQYGFTGRATEAANDLHLTDSNDPRYQWDETTPGPVIPPVVLPSSPPRRPLSGRRMFEHHDECESPAGGSCTCDLIAEYGAPSDRDN